MRHEQHPFSLSAFHWRNGESSCFAAAPKVTTGQAPKKDHPLRTGKTVTACNAFTGAGGQIDPGKPAKTYNIKGLAKLPVCSEFRLPGSKRDRTT